MATECGRNRGGSSRKNEASRVHEQPGLRAVWGLSRGSWNVSSRSSPWSQSWPAEAATGQGCTTPAMPRRAPCHSSRDPDAILCHCAAWLSCQPDSALRGAQPPLWPPAALFFQAPSRKPLGSCGPVAPSKPLLVPEPSFATSRAALGLEEPRGLLGTCLPSQAPVYICSLP